jgi:hypothetical protein
MKDYINIYCKCCGKSGQAHEVRGGEFKIPTGWKTEYKKLISGGRLGEHVCTECDPTQSELDQATRREPTAEEEIIRNN